MSTTETQDTMDMGTKPSPEHAWLKNLIGNWKTEAVLYQPDGSEMQGVGTEDVTDLGGLWALGVGKASAPGWEMEFRSGMGFDVSTKAYKAFWLASMSSHLWKYDCTLSEDGKTMTMNCVGPDMEKDGETANYRDVIEIIDADHRTLTSYFEVNGEWQVAMKVTYTRTS